MMTVPYGLYSYGLVDQIPKHLDILGIDKKNKVYPVMGSEMCVMVSVVDIEQFQHQVKDLLAGLNTGSVQESIEEMLQAHERVITALMQEATVVPLKFGTILKD